MKSIDGDVCERCVVVVDKGTATVGYKWEHGGYLVFAVREKDVSSWSNDGFRDFAANFLKLEQGADEILVLWH